MLYVECWKFLYLLTFFLSNTGIEDGQTVRVPISYGELFVTFKVTFLLHTLNLKLGHIEFRAEKLILNW